MKFAHFSHVWNRPHMTAAQRYEQLWRELELCDELKLYSPGYRLTAMPPDQIARMLADEVCSTEKMVTCCKE